MTTARESVYLLPDEPSADVVTRSLLALVPGRARTVSPHQFTILDTVDGRVQRAGAALTRAGVEEAPTVNWQTGAGTGVTMRLRRPVRFEWDLPNGPVREQVASVIGPRRLLAQADAQEQGAVVDVVDERGKTVARVRVASGQAKAPGRTAWRTLPTTITVTELRGYETAFDRLVPMVESRPGTERCDRTAIEVILKQVGAPEPHDLGALAVTLDPAVRSDVGARRIHLALLDVLTANETGVRAAIDTEFLHDFRVAIRRTRSLLGQIRGVFPDPAVVHFKTELSWIGRITGPPRDTDVLVLALRERADEFSPKDVGAIISFLGQSQQQEYERLAEALDSDRYRALLADWRAFLERPMAATADAEHSLEPLAATTARRARRLSRRIRRRSEAVDAHTPAERLHEIRIDAKKLRYLVDVMPSTAGVVSDLRSIVGALKKVQHALGDFNDAHVQETLLLDCGRAMAANGGPPGALLTLGRLAERCRFRREGLRRDVIDALARFRAREIRKACRRAFADAGPAVPTR